MSDEPVPVNVSIPPLPEFLLSLRAIPTDLFPATVILLLLAIVISFNATPLLSSA